MSTTGKSVIDYVLVPYNELYMLVNMTIIPCTDFLENLNLYSDLEGNSLDHSILNG